MTPTRRQYLVGLAASGTVALAGCGGNGGGGDEPEEESGRDPSDEVYDGLRLDGHVMSPSFPLELYEVGTDERVAQIHWHGEGGDWHQAPLQVAVGERGVYDFRINDPDLNEIPAGEGEQYQMGVELSEETPDGLVDAEVVDAELTVVGQQEGTGGLIFHILSDSERIWSSTPLPLEVTA